MKPIACIVIILLAFSSCKKSDSSQPAVLEGVWVETTLRADTLDFEINMLVDNSTGYMLVNFKSAPYSDTVLNPNYPVNHSSLYNYYVTPVGNEIALRSMYSSSTAFNNYSFAIQGNHQRFSIDKFYNRRALPAVIEFVRIR